MLDKKIASSIHCLNHQQYVHWTILFGKSDTLVYPLLNKYYCLYIRRTRNLQSVFLEGFVWIDLQKHPMIPFIIKESMSWISIGYNFVQVPFNLIWILTNTFETKISGTFSLNEILFFRKKRWCQWNGDIRFIHIGNAVFHKCCLWQF